MPELNTKHGEIFDWEGDFNYEGQEWFKDRPEKPEPPSAPPTTSDPYVPLPGVIEENDRFFYAMKHAPNVLYTRFKQYGQLGVLGWCYEFGELIEHLKQLGFEGNMFVTTRQQALDTCTEILKLKLNIKMQIVVMYLSSQVARLRRFLDGETVFDDYPETDFPIDTLI